MFKQQKGVTLVALVITIIVLLILAGVSIAMLTGDNGILTKATESKTKTLAAELREQVSLAIGELMADQENTNISADDSNTNGVADLIAAKMTKNGYTTTATSATSLSVTKDSKTYTITINDKYAVTEIKEGTTSIWTATADDAK